MGYGGREKTCENSWVLVFVRFGVEVAGNGDVAPPGFTQKSTVKKSACV